jgi:hypothetical protein
MFYTEVSILPEYFVLPFQGGQRLEGWLGGGGV